MLNVLLNLALFAVKFIGGKLSRSVSVTSDAFNNLTDAVTTLFAWIGVKVASVGAGERHPNGHGRFEWIVALLSASSIILIGWELLRDSIDAIKAPEATVFSIFTVIVLALSIGVKFFMFLYNRKKSGETDSASLKAVSVDCLSDALSTTVVLAALIVNRLFAVNIDGWCGILVSVFIMYNGFQSFGETAERIMGRSASEEHLRELKAFAMENEDFRDMEDLQIEDYGYGRFRVSMTAVGEAGVAADRLLADIADLRYRICTRYGYNAQITAAQDTGEDQELSGYINGVLADLTVPVTVCALRVSDAIGYRLAELELGIDFMNSGRKDEVEKVLTERFADAPKGYKLLTRLRLKADIDHRSRGRHFRKKAEGQKK